jgi:RND family efflux transporter MFP subunit
MSSAVSAGKRSWRSIPGVGRLSGKRGIALLVALVLSLFAGYLAYQRFAAATKTTTAATYTAQAQVGSLVTTVSSTGNVVAHLAKLSFPASGKLTSMNVSIGDTVKAGQVLAKLDPSQLEIKVSTAQSTLSSAKIKLQQLMDGATPEQITAAQAAYDAAMAKYNDVAAGSTTADMAAAEAAVNQANSTLATAQAKLDATMAGATATDMAAAEASVDQAKATLSSAQVKLEQLQKNSYTSAEWATAQADLDSKTSALKSAQVKLDEVKKGSTVAELAAQQAAVDQAKQALVSAEDKYQTAAGVDGNGNSTLADSGFSSVSAALQNYNAAKASYDAAVQKLAQLQSGPLSSDLQAAQTSYDQAQASLRSSQAKLDLMKQGPLPTDLASAQAAFDQAQAGLKSARVKLDQMRQGPTTADATSAQGSVDQAKATLASAQAKLDQLRQGPTAGDLKSAQSSVAGAKSDLASKTKPSDSDIALAQEEVKQAEASLKQAQYDVDNATLLAPFDATVAAVGPNVGEWASGSNSSTTTAIVTLVDSSAARIDATVGETDVAKIQVGQPATITFDALTGVTMTGKVIAVSPAGSSSQGVVSYQASISIDNPNRTLPSGLSAGLSIVTEQKDNVLLVPSKAIRTQGTTKTVEVSAKGKTETRTVQIGSSNDQMTEIVSGLQQGEQVVIQGTAPKTTTSAGGGMGMPGIGGPPPR